MDIEGWLRTIGLEQYGQIFRENGIDVSVLPDLTEQDLEKLDLRPFETAWQDIEHALGGSKPQFKSLTEAMRWSRRRR